MAPEASHLLLVLLVLLAAGEETVEGAKGGKDRYSNKTEHSYKAKIWRRKKASKCIWLVSTSKPRILAQDSRYTIRDDPSSGFTNVPMAELKEKDSGSYQRATKGSKGGTILYKKIHLLEFPDSLSSGLASPRHLIAVLCGLLVAKSRLPSALPVLLCCGRR
ncbi:hypothetical protein E2I00_002073, partial [Balaenoptera physalus]